MSLFVGIDLGGTKVRTALCDQKGRIIAEALRSTENRREFERVIEAIVDSIEECISSAGAEVNDIEKIGVGSAGQIDTEEGKIVFSPNLNWRNAPLGEAISAKYRRPVWVENDVRVAALGEMAFGAGRGALHLICLFVGTGIGSGIVVNGKLLRGWRNMAGEIGHTKIKPDGYPCNCGGHGCLETYVGGWYVKQRAGKAIMEGRKSLMEEMTGGQLDRITTRVVEEACQKGDTLAQELWAEIEEMFGLAVANLVTLFNPERIVLGGGVIEGSPSLIKSTEKSIHKWVSLPSKEGVKVCKAELGADAGVIGATLLPVHGQDT